MPRLTLPRVHGRGRSAAENSTTGKRSELRRSSGKYVIPNDPVRLLPKSLTARGASFGMSEFCGLVRPASARRAVAGKQLRDFAGEGGEGVRLADEVHAAIERPVMDDGVPRVAGREQDLQARGARRRFVGRAGGRSCRAITTSVTRSAVSGWSDRTRSASAPPAACSTCVAELVEHRHRSRTDRVVVLDDEDRLAAARLRHRIGLPGLVLGMAGVRGKPWQIEFHGRAVSDLAVDLDMAAGLLDEAMYLAESEAGAVARCPSW